MDDYRIDSHKLIFHVSRVNLWLEGKDIYPIYIEIGPSGACNQRCSFCALDYLDYKPQFIDKDVLMNMLSEVAKCGVKSVMFAGEGEPLLHKDIAELTLHAKKVGIDVAITTNGVLFNDTVAERCLPVLTWMRVSLNAGTPKTYSKIHRCHPEDFQKVFDHITNAVELKRQNHYPCTIGVQFLLLPDNYQEATILAKKLKDVRVDYLIIKPYSQHPLSKNRLKKGFDYSNLVYLNDELQRLSDGNFKVIFRAHTMQKLKEKKPYSHCLGLPFWAYIDSGGNLYACSAFLGDKKFCYGNIYKNSFQEIWEGAKRKEILNMFTTKLDIAQCREVCRLDEINRYLWELKNPHPHVNFI
jgi:radical SAM protein with 4Fe4S-binding SPASM domain